MAAQSLRPVTKVIHILGAPPILSVPSELALTSRPEAASDDEEGEGADSSGSEDEGADPDE